MEQATREAIEKRLEQLATLNGGQLTPEAVLVDAEDESSPLHDFFEWDDAVAGRLYRIDQARTLIRSVKIEIVVEERRVMTPRYVHDPRLPDVQGYVETVKVRSTEGLALDVVRAEMTRVVALLERARGVAQVVGLAGEVDRILEQAIALKERADRAA